MTAYQVRPRPLNQKPPRRERPKRPGDSDAHRRMVKELPCCVCGEPPLSDPHHLKAGTGERGMGLKSSDKWAIPLCRAHHNEIEKQGSARELQWLDQYGINGPELARGLWDARGDLAAMRVALNRHRGTRK